MPLTPAAARRVSTRCAGLVVSLCILLGGTTADAATYLLFKVKSGEGVPRAQWLYLCGGTPQPSHRRLQSELELLRVRGRRRLVLDHLDFTDYWPGRSFPDVALGRLEFEVRQGAIHFVGDLEIGGGQVSNIWRAESLLEACEKYPIKMTEHPFILVRPYADNDLEIENPCDPERLVVRELR